jgi:hypothetical protein
MKKKLFLTSLMLAAVLVISVTGCSAINADSLDGILQNIDSLSGNVTVTLKDGQTLNFNLEDINLDDILQAADNMSLDCGDHVRLQMRDGRVQSVSFNSTQLRGTIKAIAEDNSTVTVTDNNNTDVTLNVASETMVVIHALGRAEVNDLEAGQPVFVLYDKNTMTAEKIHVVNDGPAWQNRAMKQEKNREQHQSQQQNHEMNSFNNQGKHGGK